MNNGFNTQPSNVFDPLQTGQYIIYVQDILGCVDRDTVEIINPDSLYIDTTIFSNISCYGLSNGSIQAINGVGGTLPYEYSVGTGPHYTNMGNFNGYIAGNYMVNIFDANNCANQYQHTITEPNELDVTVSPYYWDSPPTYEIQCHGDSLGSANITVAGGLIPYTYTALDINNNLDTIEGSAGLIDSLHAGTYTFTITDANECTSDTTIIYDEPSLIEHNFIATHISCSGWSTGSLIDSVSGGNGTATSYIYSWNTGDNTYSLTSLDTGTYIMTVEDENGCVSIDSTTISYLDTLNVTATGTHVNCHGYCDGKIIATATG